jgi:hypothetical protein
MNSVLPWRRVVRLFARRTSSQARISPLHAPFRLDRMAR